MAKSLVLFRYPLPVIVWAIVFLVTLLLGLTLQKLALPLIPSLHAEHGLLQQDAIHYHNLATGIAHRIQTNGWSEWKVFPGNGGTGNVALLSALYVWFGDDPAWFLPFAAAAHATSATMVYLLGSTLWPGSAGRLGGLMGASLFILFPSAMLSYGQNYKDAFASAGMLMILYAFIRILHPSSVHVSTWRAWKLLIPGIFLVWFVRPYVLSLVGVGLLATWVVWASWIRIRSHWSVHGATLVHGALCVVVVLAAALTLPKGGGDGDGDGDLEKLSISTLNRLTVVSNWQWQSSDWLADPLDNFLKQLSVLRLGFAEHGTAVGARSQIDADQLPDRATRAMAYFPRAATIGFFAPFPSTWTESTSLIRVVGAMETAVWYLLAPGVLVLLAQRPSVALLAGMIMCGGMITFYSYIQPNVGTLYRVRSAPLSFFLLCGAVGWARLILWLMAQTLLDPLRRPSLESSISKVGAMPTVKTVSARGVGVILVTLGGYLGFLIRDLLLIKTYGMDGQLDGFFVAAMIPMFLASVVMFPVGDTMMASLIHASSEREDGAVSRLVGSILTCAVLVATAMVLILLIGVDHVLPLVFRVDAMTDQREPLTLIQWFSLLLVFSAWTVVGNGVLNAFDRPLAAAIAQLSVPIAAIGCILALSSSVGVLAAVWGMVLGTIMNAGLVSYASYQLGVPLVPRFRIAWSSVREFLHRYCALAAAALLAGAILPISYAFASRLEPGAVSAWAMGGKLTQLIVGLTSVGAAAVLTPHFARLLLFKRVWQLTQDLGFLLVGSTWLSIVFALIIVVFAEPVVVSLFHGEEVSTAQAQYLAGILRLGALQLPCIAAGTLIIKVAVASRVSREVVAAAGLGLVVNLIINSFLSFRYGVYGIAMASIVATAISTAYLVIVMRWRCGLDGFQVALLFGSWATMTGFCASLYTGSGFAWAVSLAGGLSVLAAYWRTWLGKRGSTGNLDSATTDGAR